jgi:serine/threonine protein kinase
MCEHKPYGAAVDLWAVGVLLYEMLFGKPPFMEEAKGATIRRIKSVDIRFPPKSERVNVSAQAMDLIKRLLVGEPERRLPLTRVMAHPWILQNLQT